MCDPCKAKYKINDILDKYDLNRIGGIIHGLEYMDGCTRIDGDDTCDYSECISSDDELIDRLDKLEKENAKLKKLLNKNKKVKLVKKAKSKKK